jgi:hypothetical protein
MEMREVIISGGFRYDTVSAPADAVDGFVTSPPELFHEEARQPAILRKYRGYPICHETSSTLGVDRAPCIHSY